jgi:hypothetical protein
LRIKALEIEQIAKELSGAFSDDNSVRISDALQASSEVRRLTDDATLLRLASPDQIADHD